VFNRVRHDPAERGLEARPQPPAVKERRRGLPARLLQEVPEQLNSFKREEALRVILHSLERIALVPYTHDFILIGPGDDFEIFRQCAGLDDQAVIAGRFEGIGDSSVDTLGRYPVRRDGSTTSCRA
jgi:hypothetical protein